MLLSILSYCDVWPELITGSTHRPRPNGAIEVHLQISFLQIYVPYYTLQMEGGAVQRWTVCQQSAANRNMYSLKFAGDRKQQRLTRGMYGAGISRRAKAAQSKPANQAWSLMPAAPPLRAPRRREGLYTSKRATRSASSCSSQHDTTSRGICMPCIYRSEDAFLNQGNAATL